MAFTVDAVSTGAGSTPPSRQHVTLTVTTAGTIVLDANQAADANYLAAPQVQQVLVVNQATQTIAFTPVTTPLHYIASCSPITLCATVSIQATGGATNNLVALSPDPSNAVIFTILNSSVDKNGIHDCDDRAGAKPVPELPGQFDHRRESAGQRQLRCRLPGEDHDQCPGGAAAAKHHMAKSGNAGWRCQLDAYFAHPPVPDSRSPTHPAHRRSARSLVPRSRLQRLPRQAPAPSQLLNPATTSPLPRRHR